MKQRTLIVVSVMALALAAACTKAPDDTVIANEIKAKIFSDSELKGANVDVAVTGGVATLTGELPTAELKLKFLKLAEGTAGIQRVDDQVRLPGQEVAEAQPAATAPPEPLPAQPAPAPSPTRGAASKPVAAPMPTPVAPRQAVETAPAPAAAPAAVAAAVEEPKAAPEPRPVTVELPAGTRLTVRMADPIDSSKNKTGEVFLALLDAPLPLRGDDVIPEGTVVYVRLAEAKSAGRVSGQSELELQLSRMEFQGTRYPLVSSSYQEKGQSRGKQSATRIGIATGVGAAIGAIAGGGKGAAIGAAVGGGGATAVQVFTRGQQIKVPAETMIEFSLQSPVTVSYVPGKAK